MPYELMRVSSILMKVFISICFLVSVLLMIPCKAIIELSKNSSSANDISSIYAGNLETKFAFEPIYLKSDSFIDLYSDENVEEDLLPFKKLNFPLNSLVGSGGLKNFMPFSLILRGDS